tara:strand:+ start:443 stop:913 length:471 start_codon:yes stop_codon:yes gene_type:complete
MNEAKLSNDELIRRLNELREVIVNDDILKIAREDEEIQDLLYEYKKGKSIWGGADVIISEKTSKELNNWLGNQPLVISFQTSAPTRKLVVTQHAVELSWLFIQLRELYRDRIDYISKYDFYGELAQKAIDIVKETDDKCSNRELLFEVLRRSKIYI